MTFNQKDFEINWDQKPSDYKLTQIKLLVDLFNYIKPGRVSQNKALNNFKKQFYKGKENFDFEYSDPNIIFKKDNREIKLFFNHVVPITETNTDYVPSATIILQSKQKTILIATFSDFSNKKLRKRFTGYKFLKGSFEKYYVDSVDTTKDKSLLENNGFKLIKIRSIKFS